MHQPFLFLIPVLTLICSATAAVSAFQHYRGKPASWWTSLAVGMVGVALGSALHLAGGRSFGREHWWTQIVATALGSGVFIAFCAGVGAVPGWLLRTDAVAEATRRAKEGIPFPARMGMLGKASLRHPLIVFVWLTITYAVVAGGYPYLHKNHLSKPRLPAGKWTVLLTKGHEGKLQGASFDFGMEDGRARHLKVVRPEGAPEVHPIIKTDRTWRGTPRMTLGNGEQMTWGFVGRTSWLKLETLPPRPKRQVFLRYHWSP